MEIFRSRIVFALVAALCVASVSLAAGIVVQDGDRAAICRDVSNPVLVDSAVAVSVRPVFSLSIQGEVEMKKRVKMMESIAGLGDPQPKEVLDQKYARIKQGLEMREKPPSKGTIEALIADNKKRDRYGEAPIGFSKDWSFKPGDEPLIDAALAEKWEAAGICVAVAEKKAA